MSGPLEMAAMALRAAADSLTECASYYGGAQGKAQEVVEFMNGVLNKADEAAGMVATVGGDISDSYNGKILALKEAAEELGRDLDAKQNMLTQLSGTASALSQELKDKANAIMNIGQ